jgi:hypothetical protein
MPRNDLPTYAIVELLIRLEKYDHSIGNYKDHAFYDGEVIVKTTAGSIRMPQELVQQQFESPETISDSELTKIATQFRAG